MSGIMYRMPVIKNLPLQGKPVPRSGLIFPIMTGVLYIIPYITNNVNIYIYVYIYI